MLANLMTVSEQVAILFLLIFIGYICTKKNVLSEATAKQTTNLLFYFITPCVIIKAFQLEYNSSLALGLLLAFGCAIGSILFAVFFSMLFFKKKEDKQRCVLRFAMIYSNCGFMALPMAEAVLGSEGVFYCSAYVAIFNVFAYTQGVHLMTAGSKEKHSLIKTIINPGTIGIIIGFPCFILSLTLPNIALQPVMHLSSMNTPLAMIIIGIYLAQTDLVSMIKEKAIYFVALIKLIIVPIIAMVGFKLCGIDGVLFVAMTISVCAPPAATTIMFSAKFGNDAQLAAKTVSFVTLLSILTMPVLIAFAQVIA